MNNYYKFDRFTAYYNCMTWNVRKLISPLFQCTSNHKSCSSLIWPFYDLLQLYDQKCQKTHYLHHLSAQVSQIVFLPYLTVLPFIYNCMTANVRKLIIPRFQWTSITKSILSLFDRFTAYYNCKTWNVRKLISLPFKCTSITNRFLSLFDHFTAYYNCMTWNVRKLISPPFQCTSITNRVLRLFDRFTAYYNIMTSNVRKLISPPFQCINITNRVLTLFDRFTTYYNCMTWNVRKLISPAISVHKYHKSLS